LKNTIFLENTNRIFENKLQKGKTGHVNNKNLENRKHDQRHETGRLKHAGTADELVGPPRQEGQKQIHRSTRQIFKVTDLTQYSIVQIIHCFFCLKCISFTNMIAAYYCWFFVHLYFTR